VLDEVLVFKLRRIRDVLTQAFRQSTTEARGLRAGDFGVLALIEANPDISQIELARVGGFDQTILVGVIDDLESRHWVVRQQSREDRRKRVLQITKEGRAALTDLLAKAIENEKPARKALSAAEMRAFQKALTDIYRALL
jgi:DNA-binding MarR family transcriptional regulator